MFSSAIQVLTVEQNKAKKARPDGTISEWETARCIVFKDAEFKDVSTVGRLRLPKDLKGQIKPGNYTASFSLGVPDWGDAKGDIVAQLVGLTPVPQKQPSKA
jgi:hypothetical protein